MWSYSIHVRHSDIKSLSQHVIEVKDIYFLFHHKADDTFSSILRNRALNVHAYLLRTMTFCVFT